VGRERTSGPAAFANEDAPEHHRIVKEAPDIDTNQAHPDLTTPQGLQADRLDGLQRGIALEYVSLAYNVLESVVGLAAGTVAGSVALIGFGLDSVVESSSAAILIWRFRTETRRRRSSEDAERRAVRLVAFAFFALATYIGGRAILDLVAQSRPDDSRIGIALAVASLIVMPWLVARKRKLAVEIDSRSLKADSTQTLLCTYMSAFLLVGLVANALLGWWWADPVAGLAIAALAVREGIELWREEDFCCP
jgi:divalent metal cation (Fe/Co/Zn/Cd) transporter